MVRDSWQFGGNLFRRQRRIHETGHDGIARHRRKLRALFVLRESDSACRLDRPQPCSAVTAGSGEQNADRKWSLLFGERFKEMIDRQHRSLTASSQSERAAFVYQILVWRQHINCIWLGLHWPGDF